MNSFIDKKICVGLSGGVDSSVAALLLKRAGCDVFALFMQNWNDASTTLHGECEWEEDRFVAEMVARKIGIPFYFVDLSTEYRSRVTDYMFAEYARGRTPNPDVLCNSEIKFDAFLRCARGLGAEYVATGHYCRKEPVIDGTSAVADDGIGGVRDCGGKTEYRLLAGTDSNKDQSYFLCRLDQEQLAAAVFPIGDLTKPEVRRIAKEADLPSADKKDSQGLCFVGKVDIPTFLSQALNPGEGDVIEVYDAYYLDNVEYKWQSVTMKSISENTAPPHPEIPTTPSAAIVDACGYDAGIPNSEAPAISDGGFLDTEGEINQAGKGNDGPFMTRKIDVEKAGQLSDEDLRRLSEPIEYKIEFQTETFRSGKHHVKKTRYKVNPYGAVAGRHIGACYYTIGQRKGLAIGGHSRPLFVIATDTARNLIYVGEGEGHKGLYRSCLRVLPDEVHWIRPSLGMRSGQTLRCRVRIRYRQPLQDAVLLMRDSGLYILFDKPQRGITAGQFAVWYASDAELLGSGVISR